MKGALVELVPVGSATIPTVIVFQFNPETLTHSLTQTTPSPPHGGTQESDPLAASGLPAETFGFTLSLDVTDQLIDADRAVVDDAKRYGLYTRLAALELLVHPTAVADFLKDVDSTAPRRGTKRSTPAALVPAVLFVWGPGRIVPVRVTRLSITEKLYDAALLNPTHAEAQIELQVLTADDLKPVKGKRISQLAKAAYKYNLGLRLAGAARAATTLGAAGRNLTGIIMEAIGGQGGDIGHLVTDAVQKGRDVFPR
jgi:hypothetical protein